MGFETASAKSRDIVLHDNEIFRPQKLNIKIKKLSKFSYAKEFLGYVFSAWKNSNFREKGVTKIELQNRQLFSSNFEFCQFFFHFLEPKSGVYNCRAKIL